MQTDEREISHALRDKKVRAKNWSSLAGSSASL
jgi:hypothetical protein